MVALVLAAPSRPEHTVQSLSWRPPRREPIRVTSTSYQRVRRTRASSVPTGSRVAEWRANQGTINEPGHVSTRPPISRTAGFPRSGWKSKHSVAAFPILPGPHPGQRPVYCRLPSMRSWNHGTPESLSARRTFPSSPPLPEALCSDRLLSRSSSLIRPHAPDSHSPMDFTVETAYTIGLTNESPSPL